MRKRILIFPAGAENALEIHDALQYNLNVEVYGMSGKKDYAEYLYDEAHYIEGHFYISDEDFLSKLNKVIEEYTIDVIIPTHDEIALFLAKNKEFVKTKILVADHRTAQICYEKRKMYDLFWDTDFCPHYYEDINDIPNFPVFIKPNIGAGAQNTHLIQSEKEFMEVEERDYVICEYLPGIELTVDCFTNRKGELKFVGPRSRDRIWSGISQRSTSVELSEEIENIANTINARLNFFGAWYFQVKKDIQGNYKLLEISCRQSGGMVFYRHLGINFPLMGIFELFDVDTDCFVIPGVCQMERRLSTSFRYEYIYDKVYIDLDDTIIVNNTICETVLIFLYRCKRLNKSIILLTRHDGDIIKYLEDFFVPVNLFDQVIYLSFEEEKSSLIEKEGAIFIDNSFLERKKVHDTLHIPTFDVDAVDMLCEAHR